MRCTSLKGLPFLPQSNCKSLHLIIFNILPSYFERLVQHIVHDEGKLPLLPMLIPALEARCNPTRKRLRTLYKTVLKNEWKSAVIDIKNIKRLIQKIQYQENDFKNGFVIRHLFFR